MRKTTLLALAEGRLAEAPAMVAATHLAWCRECRKLADSIAGMGASPKEANEIAIPAEAVHRGHTALGTRDRPLEAVGSMGELGDSGLPMPLALRLDGRGLAQLAWRKVLFGVAIHELDLPPGATGQLRLVRMAPGKALPGHGHGGRELSLVLRGAYRDEHGRYAIGDVADLDATCVHRPVAEAGGPCICLVAAETPALYCFWSGRLLQRLLGL